MKIDYYKDKKLIKILIVIAAILVSAMFVGEAFQGSINTVSSPTSTPSNIQTAANVNSIPSNVFSTHNYTGGTYKAAEVGNLNHLNPFEASTLCDFLLLDEVYDSPFNYFPNGTIGPWVATSVSGNNIASHHIRTIDPLTGANVSVNYIYTLHLRSNVKWQDWTSSNSKNTYTYSAIQKFTAENGKSITVNNTKIYDTLLGKNITSTTADRTMKTYYIQSVDLILSWEIMAESTDFSTEYPGIVNMVPVNNTTLEYYMSAPTPLFNETALDTLILPYHIWSAHDYSSTPGLWNYNPSAPASGSYNAWNMGYNPTTGYASGLVGSGPFMMYSGFGQPNGAWISSDYWQLYVNPDYFTQYVPSLAQYTPRIDSIYVSIYTSYSAAVAAEASGSAYSIIGVAPPPTFIPTEKAIPNTYIYDKPGTGFGYQQVNSYAGNSPFNITALRIALEYAIPKTYLASVLAEGYAIPGGSTPVPNTDTLWQASGVPYYHFNLAKAKSEIDSAINQTHGALTYSSTKGVEKYGGATLYYNGKPVKTAIQITVASEDPIGVEGANKIASYWDSLGISTSVKEESFSTVVSNLVSLSASDQTSYSSIDLGCTGWDLNPAPDLAAWENSYLGAGTGVYKGTFTSFNYTSGPSIVVNLTSGALSSSSAVYGTSAYNASSSIELIHNHKYSGKYVNSFLNKLVNESFVETNITSEHVIIDVLQYVLADEGTFENLGYSVAPIPITNSTFTGIDKDGLGTTTFWYWNFMKLHLKKPVVVVKPKALPYQLKVGVISNQRIYNNGQYGNLTIQVRNQYGQAMPNIPVSVGYSPQGGLVNISSVTGTTNSNGIYKFEFQALSSNTLVFTSDYMGAVNFTVAALAPNSNYVNGKGYTNIDISPYNVGYKIIKSPNYISTSNKSTEMEIEIYNQTSGKPISGYQYSIESLSGLLKLMRSSGQTLSNTTDTGFMSTSTVGYYYNMTHHLTDGKIIVGKNMYIADIGTNNVTRYNLTTGKMTNMTVGTEPMQLAYDSHNNTIFVTNAGSSNVTVINPTTMKTISNITVGGEPIGIAYDKYNNTMYVADSGSNTVTIINASAYNVTKPVTLNGVTTSKRVELVGKVIRTMQVGSEPMGVILGKNNTVYITNYGSHNVTAIKQMNSTIINVTANINTYGANPSGITMNGIDLFIANAGSNNITMVNMKENKLTGNLTMMNATGVPLLHTPMGIIYNNGELYVSNAATNNVTAINLTLASKDRKSGIINTTEYKSTSLFKNIMVGTMPTNLTIYKGNLYASNYVSNNITEIDMATNSTIKSINMETIVSTIYGGNYVLHDGLSQQLINAVPDYNMTHISGTTGSNGMIYLNMTHNSTFNWAINGITSGFANTYIFMGDYSAGAPMGGEAPYMDLGELTSSLNPSGFGVSQPFEVPVMVNQTSMDKVHVSMTYHSTIAYNGTTEIMLKATKAGKPLSDYNITLTAQNALGANRGIFTDYAAVSSGVNPNVYFGSTSMPEITVTTNANGIAYVNFTASGYTYSTSSSGVDQNYKAMPFTSTHLIPYDEFEIGVIGMNGTGALNYMSQANIISTPFVFNNTTSPSLYPTVTAYMLGATYSNGQYFILSDHPYTMYVNSTYNTMAGPSYKDMSITVSTNYGTLSKTSVNTGSTGSYKLTYTSASVSKVTEITISVKSKSGSDPTYYNTTFYVEPYHAPSYTLDYVVIGIVAAVAAVFAALYVIDIRKLKAATKK